jgi:hypothetical protein
MGQAEFSDATRDPPADLVPYLAKSRPVQPELRQSPLQERDAIRVVHVRAMLETTLRSD